MIDLTTKYLGLTLKNPILVGSCGLTNTVSSIRELADNNAGGVVLKSLFEEQIEAELEVNIDHYTTDYPDAFEYVKGYTRDNAVEKYLDLISDAKKEVDIPVIASINCVSASEWVTFAKGVEKAGADALEINVSLLPSDPRVRCEDHEKLYFAILDKLSKQLEIPLVLKMSRYSPALTNLIHRLSWTGNVDGFVLFNRYYRPDINIDKLEVNQASIFSSPAEMTESLRWIALLAEEVKADLVASTGVHDGAGAIKQLLAGATAVQVVSALYLNGAEQLGTILAELQEWMKEKSYTNLAQFRGQLSSTKLENPADFERIQFMRQYGQIV